MYFASPLVNQGEVYGTDTIEKGTDGGGCIEVYSSKEDAAKRDMYLASFDGATALNSGSHTVYGTVVIRTSSKLTATQQKETEKNLLEALIRVE